MILEGGCSVLLIKTAVYLRDERRSLLAGSTSNIAKRGRTDFRPLIRFDPFFHFFLLGPYSSINRLGRRPSRPIPTDSSLMCVFASKMGELTSVWQPFEVERFTKSMA